MIKNKVIQLKKIAKTYSVHHEKPTLAERLFTKQKDILYALKDITLCINKGDKIGIIGSNGSGKTTILKIISGITTPSQGCRQVVGNIVSLIDLEAGFHPDLSGKQNIFLNGTILGMKRDKINRKLKNIIAFSGIKNYIDSPIYTYSQGMKLRLGFSIAIHANPDILILDENIYTGDIEFQRQLKNKLDKLFKTKKTIIVVSHWLEFIEKNCNRVIVMEHGHIAYDGSAKDAIKYYLNENKKAKSNL